MFLSRSEPDETPVAHLIDDFGSDQLVYSTDYPHGDSRYPNATDEKLPRAPELRMTTSAKHPCGTIAPGFYAVTELGT